MACRYAEACTGCAGRGGLPGFFQSGVVPANFVMIDLLRPAATAMPRECRPQRFKRLLHRLARDEILHQLAENEQELDELRRACQVWM